MDHGRIDEQNVAELYVTGRLSPEDEETFENHLLECSECRERVGWADDLRTSIRAVAAEDVARASAQLGLLAWVSRRTRGARAGMLMAALLAVAALPAWLQADRARLSRELEQVRAEARTEAPAQPERPAAPASEPVAPPAAEPAPPASAADPKLERLAQENSRLAAELDRLRAPQPTRVVSMGVERGGDSAPALEIGSDPEPIVVALGLPEVDLDATYRVTLLEGSRKIWEGECIPDGNDNLNVLIDSSLLKPGASYHFHIEGMADGPVDLPFRPVVVND